MTTHSIYKKISTSFLFLLAIFSSMAVAQEAQKEYSISPEPKWIVAVKPDPSLKVPNASMHYELADAQVKLGGDKAEHYSHVIKVVNSTAGLGDASHIEIVFNPSYETLSLHKLQVTRAGSVLDILKRTPVKLLQREKDLESRMINGELTASLILADVRVGDRIEYAYTISGSNPVFNGKYVNFSTQSNMKGPVALTQFRLLNPTDRLVHYEANPHTKITTSNTNGLTETVFRREQVPEFQFDPTVPPGFYKSEFIQVSEFADWNEVISWGVRLFDLPSTTPASIKKQAEIIRQSAATTEDQLLMALDFVQKQIRYFSTAIGPFSHQPADPEKIMEQRYGDCKDKVALLMLLLRELNIQSDPALVSTSFLDEISSFIPNPLAFDHVIIRVKTNNETYWLDPTRSYQTGKLNQRQTVGLGKSLVLSSTAHGLVDLPGTENEERIEVHDHYQVTSYTQDPILETRITYHGILAENVREAVSSMPEQTAEMFRAILSMYYPGISAEDKLHIQDSENENKLTVVLKFKIPHFWRLAPNTALIAPVPLWSQIEELRLSKKEIRNAPLRISAPGIYRQTSMLNLPDTVTEETSSFNFNDSSPIYQFHSNISTSQNGAAVTSELHLLKNQIEAEEWNKSSNKHRQLLSRLVGNVHIPTITQSQQNRVAYEFEKLKQDIKAKRIRVTTPYQESARKDYLITTAQLEGGRLPKEYQAPILAQRGVALDGYGQVDAAFEDFNKALQLAPDDVSIINSAAVNAAGRNDDARALALFDQAEKLNPGQKILDSIYRHRTIIHYSKGQYELAKQELLSLLKNSSEDERIFATMWLYFVARELGEDPIAVTKPYMPRSPDGAWPYKLLKFITGSGDLDSAQREATENPDDASRLCEFYYFLGKKYLADGDKRLAKEYFEKSVNTGVTEFIEHALAKRALAALNQQ